MRTIYRLPPTLDADLDKLRDHTARFKAGEMSAAEYRSFRVPQGVYEQRQDGIFMLRVRIPGGAVLPHQMRTLAEIARRYGSGRLHVTTRQDIQVHEVPLDAIHPALVALFTKAGLSTRGGGGNTVRNITACADAGICPKERFDVAPHAVAMTEFLLPDPANYQLPRKYKIAFSGCSDDCIGATVNDVGFIAKDGPAGPGFAVYAGGGMGGRSRVAELLEAFVPVGDAYLVAEAVKRVFDKHGNRKNKHRARLRFVVEEKGFDGFRALYKTELARLREAAPPAPEVRELPAARTREPGPAVEPADGFDAWRDKNVSPQKQAGYFFAQVPIFLGDLNADLFETLADVVEMYGEGAVRTTPSQNFVIRWVRASELPGLHRKLSALGLAPSSPPILREAIACTGAATCKLGICLSQALARAVRTEMDGTDLDLDDARDVRLYINGCPNCCGRHPIASIAFAGAARRKEGRLVPHYMLQLGGRVGEGRTRLAEGNEVLPARHIPEFVVAYLRAFRGSRQYPDFDAFLAAGGRDTAVQIAAKYKDVPSFEQDRVCYSDWGADEPFSLAGRGPGECSAGVFDLIRVDMASARDALQEGNLLSATALAARAMLVTRGEEVKEAADSLRLFEQHFLDPGHVDASFRELITSARRSVAGTGKDATFEADADRVAALVEAVEALYENMDQSLRFHAPAAGEPKPHAEPADTENLTVDREADLRGVTCPLNYVKTKMLLSQMRSGQVLSVLLDEAGGRSVPQSAEKDGHQVLSEQQEDGRWRVLIRKG